MKKVLLCEEIHQSGRRLLEDKFQVVVAPDPYEKTIRSLIGDSHGVIVRTASRITGEIIEAGKVLEVIGRTGAGVDNIDVEAATRRGISICYTPEANFISVAEHTISLILALAKQLPVMDKAVREGRFSIRYEYLPVDVYGKTVGIVGFGRIGREVANRCAEGLKMKAVWYDPYVSPVRNSAIAGSTCGISNGVKDTETFESLRRLSNLEELFEKSDFVTIHLPHNKETHHMIGKNLIERMRPSSYFINTSRGTVIDEDQLQEALIKGRIAGAGIDVYEKEPPDTENPFLKLPNVILTPHSAALTKECVERMAVDAAQGVLDILEGRRPRFVFNQEIFGRE